MKFKFCLLAIVVLLDIVESNFLTVLNSLTHSLYKTSPKCQQQLTKYAANLRWDIDSWALQMLDASSKIPSGILSYDASDLGSFQQCVNIEVNTASDHILGKYCLGSVQLNANNDNKGLGHKPLLVLTKDQLNLIHNMTELLRRMTWLEAFPNLLWALCIPNGCTASDAKIIGNYFLWSVVGPDLILDFNENYCQTKNDVNKNLSHGAIIVILILSLLLCWVTISTAVDVFYKTRCPKMFYFFSIYTNGSKIIQINRSKADRLACLDGVKFISMLWIVAGHQCLTIAKSVLINPKAVMETFDALYSMIIINTTLAVDTFLTITGLLTSYFFLRSKQLNAKFNLLLFYFHRYLRLTAPLLVVIPVYSSLLTYMGSGPRWPFIEEHFQQPCVDYWWSVLLYVQNYVNVLQPCIGQTWYICIDMQLYLISPVILYFLWKYPKSGFGFLSLCLIGLITLSFYTAWSLELTALTSNLYRSVDERVLTAYFKTHLRAAPWVIGIMAGYLVFKIHQTQIRLKLRKGVVMVGWILCLVTLFICVFGGHSTLRTPEYDRFWNSMHIAFIRPAWAIAICWIVLACVTNNGGPIGWMLSLPIYQVFNKLIYSIFLVHIIIIYMVVYDRKLGQHFSIFSLVYEFLCSLSLSVLVAIPLVLTVELPIKELEKYLINKYFLKKAAATRNMQIVIKKKNNYF